MGNGLIRNATNPMPTLKEGVSFLKKKTINEASVLGFRVGMQLAGIYIHIRPSSNRTSARNNVCILQMSYVQFKINEIIVLWLRENRDC